MSTTSPSCWLLHQDRFFQPGQYIGQPAAEILSKAVAIAPNPSFSTSSARHQDRRGHGYHPKTDNNYNNTPDHVVVDHHQDVEKTEQEEVDEKAAERDLVDGPRGLRHRRGVSASLRGFFRHGPRYGGAAWIELE